MEEKIYESERGVVHYWICTCDNSKDWLVFLPGLTAEHHLFDKQIEYFRQKYNCLTWDAPAHGESRLYAMDFTLDEIAHVLHELLEREKIENPVLIGQSYGGYISQVYAEFYPKTIRAFVSVDSCPLKKKYYAGWVLAYLKHTEWIYRSIPWKMLVKWSLAIAASADGKRNYKEAILAYKKDEFCKLSGRGFATVAEAVEKNRSYEMNCPVLLICGEKDVAGFVKAYNRRWNEEEGHKLVWISGAGHNSNIDAPNVINQEIEQFLNRNRKAE